MKTIIYEVTDFLCEECEKELHTTDGAGYVKSDGDYYCYKCAYKKCLIDEEEFERCKGWGY